LYGEAQEKEYRRDLSQIREGEYEALYSKVNFSLFFSQFLYLILFRFENKNGNLILVRY
jgi:hypothetical protein